MVDLVISFDIDGTLEVGDPPGGITREMVLRARERGFIIGSCSDRSATSQRAIWERLEIEADFIALKHKLDDVKAQFTAQRYLHIGDRDLDQQFAEAAGFDFLWAHEADTEPWLDGPAAAARIAPIIPTLRYQDAHAAIRFLVEAFGFQEHAVHPGDDGSVEHAQLIYGDAMVMLGSARDGDPFSALGPASLYVVVEDADAHHAQAHGAGARIVMPVEDQDYGGRLYVAADAEGNLWSFGTYRPEV